MDIKIQILKLIPVLIFKFLILLSMENYLLRWHNIMQSLNSILGIATEYLDKNRMVYNFT